MSELTTYKTLPYESVNIDFTEDAYVNITSIAKHYGKKTADYLKLQKTKEYISALAQKLSVDGNPATEETLVVTVEAKLFNGNGV